MVVDKIVAFESFDVTERNKERVFVYCDPRLTHASVDKLVCKTDWFYIQQTEKVSMLCLGKTTVFIS